MISVATNPTGVDEAFFRGLDLCFPGAWTEASYRWHFRRPFAGREPDTLAVLNDGAPVAGLGLNYRQLAKPGGAIVDVAVITAAWTLPRDRGRGYLLKLLRATVARARERGCRAVLSFMTADNASAVLVRRAGGWSVPTFYLTNVPSSDGPSFEGSPGVESHVFSTPAIRFHYASPEDWRSQFVDRPLATEHIASNHMTAVVERTPVADRLLMLVAPRDVAADALEAHARAARGAGRGFFHVTTSAELARDARARGITVRAGHLMVQDIAVRPEQSLPRHATWQVHSGDRM